MVESHGEVATPATRKKHQRNLRNTALPAWRTPHQASPREYIILGQLREPLRAEKRREHCSTLRSNPRERLRWSPYQHLTRRREN